MKFPTEITISIPRRPIDFFKGKSLYIVSILLTLIAGISFDIFLNNGLGLAYNDARSHLDIGRRVVEGLKPGLAQIGSVWLPLPHLLMVPTVWIDTMWHTGLSGALQSMLAFIATGILIYLYLKKLGVGIFGRITGVFVFVSNLNVLYLQSTAMTELLLIGTMTAGCYYLLLWQKGKNVVDIVKAAAFIMLSSLIRYDGWFLFIFAGFLIIVNTFRRRGYKEAEGTGVLYATLGGIGIFLWFLWNLLIFKDPLYFALGPFSAHAQQVVLEKAGVLATKHDLGLSIRVYLYSMVFNSYAFVVLVGAIGAILFWLNKKISSDVKIITLSLMAPLIFNILALFFGHSVIFVQGISGDTWFNIRYGVMLLPSIAIFVGFLVHKLKSLRWVIAGLLLMTTFFAVVNQDAVSIDDARSGSSQKNVTEVSGWLHANAKETPGFIMISAASHDAIIFSSKLSMKKFIHEGTGAYWKSSSKAPDRWSRWLVMRTYDDSDLTWKAVNESGAIDKYDKVQSFPFADIYQLKEEYLSELNTEATLNSKEGD